ncbi:MAG: cytochrome c [Myxococcales bacterium]|nr:cytochrome c [Myxococcales bacterium]
MGSWPPTSSATRALARPDDALLRSIADGTVGRIGAMPAWRAILSAEQQRQVLAYIRAAFTPTPPR